MSYRAGERSQADGEILSLSDKNLKVRGEILKGMMDLRANDGNQAEISFKEGLSSSDEAIMMRAALGTIEVYLRIGKPDEAISICNEVLGKAQIEKKRDSILLLRGMSSRALGRINEAALDFEEVVRHSQSPWRSEGLLLLAQTFWENNNYDRLTQEVSSKMKDLETQENSPELDYCILIVADANFSLKHYREA